MITKKPQKTPPIFVATYIVTKIIVFKIYLDHILKMITK